MKVNKAFTLIELLLVVLIVGIVLALAVPNFSKGYSLFELNKIADDLLATSRWAQAMAIGQERTYALSFSGDRHSYGLARAKVNDGLDDQDSFEPVSGNLGKMHVIPQAIDLVTQNDRIEFYPDGTIDQATIQLISPKKKIILSTTQMRGMMIKVDHD